MTDSNIREAQPLAGVRVLEVASWIMVPAAGAILADWGAEIIKVEHPLVGDPIRGLTRGPMAAVTNLPFHNTNRGKRSIGIDVSTESGRHTLYRLAESCDVFLTNVLPARRTKLGIDVEDIRKHNPEIVYARGSGLGPRGPERDRPGFDYASFWCRSGIADAYHTDEMEYPLRQSGGFGDLISGAVLAGGIAAALVQRAAGGKPAVVDTSLLGVGAWLLSMDIAARAANKDYLSIPKASRSDFVNPLINIYKTRDAKFLSIVGIQSDRHWPVLCDRAGQPVLRDDPRFVDSAARAANRVACTNELDVLFASKTLAEWREAFADSDLVWEPVQNVDEVSRDPQLHANEYLVEVEEPGPDGPQWLVSPPVQFEEHSNRPSRAPEHGEQTEQILLEMGFEWDEIATLKDQGAIC